MLNSFNLQFSPIHLNFLLQVGISFYTFQTMGYILDAYKKKIKPEKNIGIFALYVSFFPQLVAGPIERAKNLLPKFYKKYKIDLDKMGLVKPQRLIIIHSQSPSPKQNEKFFIFLKKLILLTPFFQGIILIFLLHLYKKKQFKNNLE